MHTSRLKSSITLVVLASFLLIANPATAAEKLKVFILAGQSNMVGHARAHTIATLFHSDSDRDKELVELVFKDGGGVSSKMLEEQLALGRKIDELTGGISNDKIKAMSPGAEKTAMEAEVYRDPCFKSRIGE